MFKVLASRLILGISLWTSCVSLCEMCPPSSGLQLALSGFPQLSSVRLDSSSSAPRGDERLLSRRGHPDASAEISEEEKLPDPERPLRQEVRVERMVSLRGKARGSQRHHAPSHPETLRRGKEEEGDAGGETPTQKTGSEKELTGASNCHRTAVSDPLTHKAPLFIEHLSTRGFRNVKDKCIIHLFSLLR